MSLATDPFFPRLETDLARVRDVLGLVRIADRDDLAGLTGQQHDAWRRLVRPALALLSYYVLTDPTRPADERAVRAAAAVELTPTGSLYHDDVIDHAQQRRGPRRSGRRPTLNSGPAANQPPALAGQGAPYCSRGGGTCCVGR